MGSNFTDEKPFRLFLPFFCSFHFFFPVLLQFFSSVLPLHAKICHNASIFGRSLVQYYVQTACFAA